MNAILECVHQTIIAMLHTSEIDMPNTINESAIADILTNTAYYTVLKTSPGVAIFGRDMLFDVPFLADWSKIGEYRQKQMDKKYCQRKQ